MKPVEIKQTKLLNHNARRDKIILNVGGKTIHFAGLDNLQKEKTIAQIIVEQH